MAGSGAERAESRGNGNSGAFLLLPPDAVIEPEGEESTEVEAFGGVVGVGVDMAVEGIRRDEGRERASGE